MVQALRVNQGVVDELSNGYTMFRFTGGSVAPQRWALTALGAYLRQPFAVDRIVTAEAKRYRQLAVEIMTLGQTIAESGPKALRRRFDLADRFDADVRRNPRPGGQARDHLDGASRGTGSAVPANGGGLCVGVGRIEGRALRWNRENPRR